MPALTGKTREDGSIDGLGRAVFADSVATTAGSLIGTSTTTSYIESGAGVREGGRTGLTALACAGFSCCACSWRPLRRRYRVGRQPRRWSSSPCPSLAASRTSTGEDASEYGPAVLVALVMPFTFSIATGIAVGFIAYVAAGTAVARRVRHTPPCGFCYRPAFCISSRTSEGWLRVGPTAPDVFGQIEALSVDTGRPLIVTDADEVLFVFMADFERHLDDHGHYYDWSSYALFGNIRRCGDNGVANDDATIDLLDSFFDARTESMDAVPGASESLAALNRLSPDRSAEQPPLHPAGRT